MTEEARKLADELKPCPFCGGKAERYDDHDTGSTNEGMSCITCKSCGASSAMHGERKENLVDSWNTRAALRSQPGTLAREAPFGLERSGLREELLDTQIALGGVNHEWNEMKDLRDAALFEAEIMRGKVSILEGQLRAAAATLGTYHLNRSE